MTWQQFIILFIVYLICAAPFVRIMLKWDKNNDFRENETKINLMMLFTVFVLPCIVFFPFLFWLLK